MCALQELAKRLEKPIKELCHEASPTVGPSAYLEYTKFGTVPNWLEEWCRDRLIGEKPRRAQNMSPGLFGQEVVDNESDAIPQA